MAFKLAVIREVESGERGIKATTGKYGIQSHSTVTTWLRKHGNLDWENKSTFIGVAMNTPNCTHQQYQLKTRTYKTKIASWKTTILSDFIPL